MSYCRFGSDSEVYVYAGSYELDKRELMYWDCCGCILGDNFKADSPMEMIVHLGKHRAAGHKVPDDAIERLQWEAERMPGVQITAEEWDANLYKQQTSLSEAVDLIEELVQQACWDNQGRINDMAISTYEEACDYLATVRPERWKREPFGLRRLEVE